MAKNKTRKDSALETPDLKRAVKRRRKRKKSTGKPMRFGVKIHFKDKSIQYLYKLTENAMYFNSRPIAIYPTEEAAIQAAKRVEDLFSEVVEHAEVLFIDSEQTTHAS